MHGKEIVCFPNITIIYKNAKQMIHMKNQVLFLHEKWYSLEAP